jgi:hypothetical protein
MPNGLIALGKSPSEQACMLQSKLVVNVAF